MSDLRRLRLPFVNHVCVSVWLPLCHAVESTRKNSVGRENRGVGAACQAHSREDLDAYFHTYRSRDALGFIMHRLQQKSVQTFRNFASPQSRVFDYGKRAFFFIKKLT